jgi:Protein of unknown function (DUF3142)
MSARLNNKFWLLPVLPLLAISLFVLRSREVIQATHTSFTLKESATALATLPPVILWAWERPEELDLLDPHKAGVAFLAKTVNLRGSQTVIKPRLQPLKLAAGVKLVAVIRIESDRNQSPQLTPSQLETTTCEIVGLSKLPSVTAVQIDFDATVSQRQFYRALLWRVRNDLPPSIPLSITALASWCAGDNWISDLPIDEAVPMLFRMGVDRQQFESRLKSGQAFESLPCQNSAGVSTDEPITAPAVMRLYIFNPKPWSRSSANRAMEAYNR